MSMTAQERKALAEELRLDEQYLYQCLSGRKAMKPADAVRIEHESGRRLRRWDLRSNDWHLIWPELIGSPGAPSTPQSGLASAVLENEFDHSAVKPAPHQAQPVEEGSDAQ